MNMAQCNDHHQPLTFKLDPISLTFIALLRNIFRGLGQTTVSHFFFLFRCPTIFTSCLEAEIFCVYLLQQLFEMWWQTVARWGTHKKNLVCKCVCVYVCVCTLGNSALVLLSPPCPIWQIQHPDWRTAAAKPHLGTLSSVKEIRPQRLIKTSESRASGTRGHQRGEPFSATNTPLSWVCARRSAAFQRGQKRASLPTVFIISTSFSLAVKWCLMFYYFLLDWQSHSHREGEKFPSLDQLLLS